MAWTAFSGTLAPGASTRWWYSWGGDRHVQVAWGNPLNPNAKLFSYDPSKHIGGGSVIYEVSIRNAGPWGTDFNLQGGGLT